MAIKTFLKPTKSKIIIFVILLFLFLPIVMYGGCSIKRATCPLEYAHINYLPPIAYVFGYFISLFQEPFDESVMQQPIGGWGPAPTIPYYYYLIPLFLAVIYYLISCLIIYKRQKNNKTKLN